MSVSTEMRLKLPSTAASSAERRAARGTSTSVSRKTSMVARLGSIIPAPLAKPTMLPSPTAARRTLGYRSVVRMPSAPGRAVPAWRAPAAAGSAQHLLDRQPPADHAGGGRENLLRCQPQHAGRGGADALGRLHPVRGAHVGRPCCSPPARPSAGASSRLRPTITGAPGKAFRVNRAAKAGVGRSSATSTRLMLDRARQPRRGVK